MKSWGKKTPLGEITYKQNNPEGRFKVSSQFQNKIAQRASRWQDLPKGNIPDVFK